MQEGSGALEKRTMLRPRTGALRGNMGEKRPTATRSLHLP